MSDAPKQPVYPIDYTVYYDVEHQPTVLETREQKVDYVRRICDAWDRGNIPNEDTFLWFRSWRAIFDAEPILDSNAYHAFRELYHWPEKPARWMHLVAREPEIDEGIRLANIALARSIR